MHFLYFNVSILILKKLIFHLIDNIFEISESLSILLHLSLNLLKLRVDNVHIHLNCTITIFLLYFNYFQFIFYLRISFMHFIELSEPPFKYCYFLLILSQSFIYFHKFFIMIRGFYLWFFYFEHNWIYNFCYYLLNHVVTHCFILAFINFIHIFKFEIII